MEKSMAFLLMILITVITACDSNDLVPGIQKQEQKLNYRKTELGGCFLKDHSSRENNESEPDTVYYSITGKDLVIHVGINYNCCGQLSSQVDLNNKLITIIITDVCKEFCQCCCICHFTFDHKFSISQQDDFKYNVWLKGYQETEYTLFRSGNIFLK